ncbi:MAG TPA: hypothetical protein VJB05_04110 [archaeon]|nr:hypothetical protein [archaeon]
MKTESKCQRCGFSKQSNYGNEKCPKCGAFLRLIPMWINGKYFL